MAHKPASQRNCIERRRGHSRFEKWLHALQSPGRDWQPVEADVDHASVDQTAFQGERRLVSKVALLSPQSAVKFDQARRYSIAIQCINPEHGPGREYARKFTDNWCGIRHGLEHAKA
jgi:hypothetical protein